MSRKYIKVTDKGKNPCIVLASNEAFYRSRGYKIDEATDEEIKKCFPEEAVKQTSDKVSTKKLEKELIEEKENVKKLQSDLELEKKTHNETVLKLKNDIDALVKEKSELEKQLKSKEI